MSRSVQKATQVMSDAELHKLLERTVTTSGPDTYVETGWPQDNNETPQ